MSTFDIVTIIGIIFLLSYSGWMLYKAFKD